MREHQSWGEVLAAQADARGDELAFSFLGDGEIESDSLTYGALTARAVAVAAMLRERGAVGEPVLLLYPPGLDYVVGFFGCLYAGAMAVPLYPPDPQRMSRTLPRLSAVAADARARFALTTAELAGVLDQADSPAVRGLTFLDTGSAPPAALPGPAGSGGDVAYLQYTSGSTGSPKGVMVTHRNLLDHCPDLAANWGIAPGARIVSWLPLFHDMGLIAAVFAPLWAGVPTRLMSPAAFVQRPVRWLRAIDEFAASVSGAPNFAYDLCVDRVSDSERDSLELSRWSTAFNAAEPVRAGTLRRFTAAFAASGFRPEAFFPSYGLAEATLLISGLRRSGPPRVRAVDADALAAGELRTPAAPGVGVAELVGCGFASPSYDMRVVDPDTFRECPDGRLGEIWAAGPCVADGYRDHPEASAEVFGAFTEAGDGPFLRTGDLGFRYEGELYPASRLKDLIIVHGRNHYPSDVEQAAERSDPLLRRGCVAAVATEQERVLILQEVREPADGARLRRAIDAIRTAVTEQCEFSPDEVVLLERGQVLKTSSGKIQRRLCRDRYLAGELRVLATDHADTAPVAATAPRDRATAWLRARLPAALARPDVALVAAGLDSLRATELGHLAQTVFGIRLPSAELLDGTMTANRLLGLLTVEGAARSAAETPAPPGEYPLSPGQRGLWFLYRLDPASPAYNQVFSASTHAEPDVVALRAALHALVARHPVLRTTYGERDGRPVQTVRPEMTVPLEELEATDWSDGAVEKALADAVHRAFDLHTEPPLRVSVLRLSSGEIRLLLCLHHIAVDFWSLDVLVDELGEAYRAAVAGAEPGTALGAPPADHIAHGRAWQEHLADPAAAADARYWGERLNGVPAALDLPVARRRPRERSGRGDMATLEVDAALTRRLHAFARAAGATPYTVLLCAFQTLLHRYSGADDIVVGSPTAGREDARFGDTLGYLVNMVGMRARFDTGSTFRAAVAEAVVTVAEAVAHQGCPLSDVVDRLGLDRDASRAPLFDIAFLVQQPRSGTDELVRFALGKSGARMDLGGLAVESAPVPQQVARFDLELWISAADDGLLAALRYSTDLFDERTAGDLLASWRTLLGQMLEHPDTPVHRLPLLSAAEQQVLTGDWNATTVPYRSGVCLHELVEAAVDRAPEATAVVFGADTLTYRETDERANRIAHALRAAGVLAGEPVAVLLERGPELVTAVLGVLKAGAAYVPVEPGYPDARIAATFGVLEVRIVLTQHRHLARFGDETVFPTVAAVLDVRADGMPHTRPGVAVDPRALAYVIPTSGSTGEPKCVALTHSPVVNTIDWVNRRYRVGPADRVLLVTSLCFDLSVYDVFGVLAAGGSIRVAAAGEIDDPRALLQLLAAGDVTFWDSAPAALGRLVPFLSDVDTTNSALRLVFLSGDWIPVPLPDEIRAAFPAAAVVALGGATEAAIWSNVHDIDRIDPEWSSIPYGRPIQNARYYVLDRALGPCPVGVPGELYIGGDCLAAGYAGDHRLSARRFVADPFAGRPGARMYRTGDRARFWADGTIEFLGRADTMLKVRGYRVEPGEVETLLARHPRVRQAAVIGVGERDEQRLVGYVTPTAEAAGGQNDWARVFDDVYAEAAADPALHLAGWVNGHTGLPFPAEQMQEWVDTTVSRIAALTPPDATVLEIGCGTGLVLARLAPRCARYVGTDISATALSHVRDRLLPSLDGLAERVRVHHAPAHELTALADERFDVIVLNSVVQYFPDVDYLVAVLRSAAELLAPGGHLFVGDVRNLATEPELRTSVALSRAAADAACSAVSGAAAAESRRERELLLHPDFFARLCAAVPALAGARVLLKDGATVNELTAFRYDAVLAARCPDTAADSTTPREIAYRGGPLTDVVRAARAEHQGGIRVTGVPDRRLAGPCAARRALDAGDAGDAAALRALLADTSGVNPGDTGVSAEPGWRTEAHWPASGRPGEFDLLLLPATAPSPLSTKESACESAAESTVDVLGVRCLANRPAQPGAGTELAAELREYLRARVPDYLVPGALVVLPEGLPVTANGKLDRAALPEPAHAPAAEFAAPADEVQRLLAGIWADVLDVARVGVHDRFFELGGDSILSMQVVSRAARHGVHLVPRDLFQYQTVAELADAVRERPGTASAEGDDATGLSLGPAQDWFVRLDLAEPDHFNQAVHLVVRGAPLDAVALAGAIRETFGGHEIFRLRWRFDGGWTQSYVDEPGIAVRTLRHTGESVDAAADPLNAELDLANGPLAQAGLVLTDTGCVALLLAVHHLAVDGVSWWTLVEDIGAAYRRRVGEDSDPPAPATLPYAAWVRALYRRADDDALLAQLPGWRALLAAQGAPLPRDHGAEHTGVEHTGTEADALTAVRELDAGHTERLLTEASRAHRTHIDELLLAAFAAALSRWRGVRRVRVDLEGHGRDAVPEADVSRTVAWFTTFTPVVLDVTGIDPATEPGRLIEAIKDQRRALPGDAAAWEILRNRPERPLDDLPGAEVGFNYLGRTDRIGGELFELAAGAGRTRAAANRRPYLWEVNCQVSGGRFTLSVTSTATAYERSTVDALAQAFADALRALIEHCTTTGAGEYTPADFPLARLDTRGLRAALTQFRGAGTTTDGGTR